jgi:hypothetical protein
MLQTFFEPPDILERSPNLDDLTPRHLRNLRRYLKASLRAPAVHRGREACIAGALAEEPGRINRDLAG